jgi:uncharacterized repeat protein (TIGR03803 family)
MKSIMKHWASTFGIYLCASSIVLALVFVLVPTSLTAQSDQGQNYKILHRFAGGTDGSWPFGVILDATGNLYGTTGSGSDPSCDLGCGVVFKLDPAGAETVLHTFGGADGFQPLAGLIRDTAGNLYGTTGGGGAYGWGTVFKLDPAGALTVLYSFTGGADGSKPEAGVIRDAAGNLYGTTQGFASGWGTIFRVDPVGKESTLYNFTGGADGSNPEAGLIYAAGNLYGTTYQGGDLYGCFQYGCGVVFKMDANGTYTVLHTFTGGVDGVVFLQA